MVTRLATEAAHKLPEMEQGEAELGRRGSRRGARFLIRTDSSARKLGSPRHFIAPPLLTAWPEERQAMK